MLLESISQHRQAKNKNKGPMKSNQSAAVRVSILELTGGLAEGML